MDLDPDNHKQLAAHYKKSGMFDKQRRLLLENFRKSETHLNLLLKLKLLVESKIKSDPSLLKKNRGKMAALIQGEIVGNARSEILSIVDKDIQDKIIDSLTFHKNLKAELSDIRRKAMGISDEEYQRQQEDEERQRQEREFAYKNNFKLKLLDPKVVKPPRFSFREKDTKKDKKERLGPLMY